MKMESGDANLDLVKDFLPSKIIMKKELYRILKIEYFESINELARLCSKKNINLKKLEKINKRVSIAKQQLIKNGVDPDKNMIRNDVGVI